MALNKYKLGDLIELCEETNQELKYKLEDVKGISIKKIFIETKADMQGVSLKPYLLVKPDCFAYVPVTSRNGEKITLAHNTTNDTYIVSSSYIVFKVKDKNTLNSDYLYMYFNRPEFDRFARYNSWGSARETFSYEDLCDIEINLPDLPTQNKYVKVYLNMLANQKSYEKGLDDLKLVYESHFDKAKKEIVVPLGKLIDKNEKKNTNLMYGINDVKGITNQKKFDNTKADVTDTNLSKFLIIEKNCFAYNSRTDGRDMLVLALNRDERPVIVTSNYNSFKIKETKTNVINPEYLYLFFSRKEFDRKVRFDSWGSSQEQLSWDSLCQINIPLPTKKIQDSIAEIGNVYLIRKEINEKLKEQIKNICPILIKGAIEEAKEA